MWQVPLSMYCPNILLYVVDCLRADRLGCYGYSKSITPNLDNLASEALLFEKAYAQATWTYPSGASILSALYPSSLGIQRIQDPMPANMPWLPEVFQEHNYTTACFSANLLISEFFGFQRGFDLFVDQFSNSTLSRHRLPVVIQSEHRRILEEYADLSDLVVVTSDDLHRAFTEFVRHRFNSPFFAVIWSMDTHDPYFDRAQLNSGVPAPLYYQPDIVSNKDPERQAEFIDLYDLMVAYNDLTLGDLLRSLQTLNQYDETMIIVLSDHGEAFGEHGIMTHSGPPYGVQTHVPLLIKFPQSVHGGERCSHLVQLTDILPTLLEYLDLEHAAQEPSQGCSLLHSSSQEAIAWSEGAGKVSVRANRWRYMQRRISQADESRPHRRSVVESIRLLRSMRLYDLRHDPEENRNILLKHPGQCIRLAQTIQSTWQQSQKIREQMVFAQDEPDLDRTVEDRLRALGYLS
jgi:arylsulfatase A-like enzyme